MTVHPLLALPLRTLAGYVVAVCAAAGFASFVVCIPQLQDGIRTYGMIALFAGFYAVSSAWPGFLLTVYLAHRLEWRSPFKFALAGGLNALLSIAIVALVNPYGGASILSDFGLAAVAGGIAGGLAYARFTLTPNRAGGWDAPREKVICL